MQNKWKKLTHESMAAMLADYKDGYSIKQICGKYGVGRATVTWHVNHQGMLSPSQRAARANPRFTYLRAKANEHNLHIRAIVAIYRKQQGRCALCAARIRLRNGPRKSTLHLDHDHATGRVRGCLCGRCNTRLGRFEQDPGWYTRAAAYVQGRSFTT